MREILSLHIGQGGIQIGDACWELFCIEHGIELDGQKEKNGNDIEEEIAQPHKSFFEEAADGKYRPRSIFVDLEPSVLDEVRNGTNKQLYFPDQLISSKEDTGNNFARCHNTIGKDIMNTLLDKVRKITEKCSDFEGFLVYNSVAGGTGSGFGSLLLEQLQQEYSKKLKFGFNFFPSEQSPRSVLEPFNSIFCSNALINVSDISFVFDNAKIFDICQNKLGIQTPSLGHMNQLTAQVISSITASMRFGGALNFDLNEILNNLVIFPRLHFLASSYASIFPVNKELIHNEELSVINMTNSLLDTSNNLAQFNQKNNYIMANTIMYRGEIVPKYVSIAFNDLKQQRALNYLSCSLSKIRLGVNYQPPCQLHQLKNILGKADKDCSMISNSTGVAYIFKDLKAKYDIFDEKKTFVQQYLNEGMEEQEFVEAKENIIAIEKEYEQLFEDQKKQDLATSEGK